MTIARQRLYINIDHVATIRQARRGTEPVPVDASPSANRQGRTASRHTCREDRRHMNDADIDAVAQRSPPSSTSRSPAQTR
jgi:Pyridoxal phosphate biosynthesis protein